MGSKNITRGLAAVLIVVAGVLLALHSATASSGDVIQPGTLASLPAADNVVVEPTNTQAHIGIRQALDAAEAAVGTSDASVDLTARPVLASLTVGASPTMASQYYQRTSWLVTFNRDTYSAGPKGAAVYAKHKLVVAIDAVTGQFVIAYDAGPATLVATPSGQ